MAVGIKAFITSATVDGVTYTNQAVDLDDLLEPIGDATPWPDKGFLDSGGIDISQRYLEYRGGTQLPLQIGLKDSTNTDLYIFYAAKGTGLDSILQQQPLSGVDAREVLAFDTFDANIICYTPKAFSQYTFNWGAIDVDPSSNGTLSSNGPGGPSNGQYFVQAGLNPGFYVYGTVPLTVTDNVTGQTASITTNFWLENIV